MQLAKRVEHDRQSTDVPRIILDAAKGKPQLLYAGHDPSITVPTSGYMLLLFKVAAVS